METFVLVHGAWHGGWCWYKVIPLLEKEGHRVEAPDMPGHGRDKTPISEITFESYVQRVCGIIDAQSEPVILVGHSYGGLIITQVAEYRPEKIKLLVYLTALLETSGEPALNPFGKESILMPNVIVSEDQSYSTVRTDAVKEVFYHDCSDEDVALAKLLLIPQVRTLPDLSNTTEQNFGRIPRVYIECLQDKAITPLRQKEMYTRLHCQKVISMNTSHSPFFSAPVELAKNLISLAD